jgi:hypothetical protein
MIEELKKLIYNISNTFNDYLLNLKKYSLQNIFIEEYYKTDNSIYDSINRERFIRKIRNRVFLEEILNIGKKFKDNNINIVNIKGLLLANDLYSPPEIRYFNDIDLLVAKSSLEHTLLLFSNMDYKIAKEDSFNGHFELREARMSNINQYITNVFSHTDVLRKIYKKIPINIELHLNFANSYEYNLDTNKIISRAEISVYNNIELLQLELHDRLIQLAIHFCKHLAITCGSEIFTCSAENRFFSLGRFYDIILFIHKYRKAISFSTIIKRSIEIGACDKIAFIFIILNGIYKNIIPLNVINELKKHIIYKNDFFRNVFFYYLMEEDPINIIFLDYYKFNSQLFSIVGYHKHYLCTQHKKDVNKYDISIYSYGDPDVIKRYQVSFFTTWWDQKHLFYKLRIFNNDIYFRDIKYLGFEQDAIEILLCKSQFKFPSPIVQRLLILPINNSNIISVKIKDTTNNIFLDATQYFAEISFFKDGYEILVGIQWDWFGEKPFIGKHIKFNLGIYYYDAYLDCINGKITMAPEAPTDSDPSYYGTIILSN